MSKTAQRKQSAYANGYRVGRYGWPSGVKCYRLGMQADGAWLRGRADGKRDRLAAERVAKAWPRRLLDWLKRLVSL